MKGKMQKHQREAIRKAQAHARRGDEWFAIYYLDAAKRLGPVPARSANSVRRALKHSARAQEGGSSC